MDVVVDSSGGAVADTELLGRTLNVDGDAGTLIDGGKTSTAILLEVAGKMKISGPLGELALTRTGGVLVNETRDEAAEENFDKDP